MKSNKTFLYQKVFTDIKEKIEGGQYTAGQLLPSEREIGEAYQVDRTTVRKALQLLCEQQLVTKLPGKGTCISSSASKKQPSLSQSFLSAAAVPSQPPSRNIGFILPRTKDASDRITFPTYAGLFFISEKECSRNNLRMIYMTLDEQDDLQSQLGSMEYAGIIFLSAVSEKHIRSAIQLGIPSVLVNNYSSLVTSIMPDNFSGGCQAAGHLLDMGHRDFLILAGNQSSTNCQERVNGFIYALRKRNISLDESHILGGSSWTFDYGYQEILSHYHSFSRRPTAIFACGDRLALGAIKALGELGLRVPEQVSIIGYDNSEQAHYATPKLTSVDTNLSALGKTAVYTLMNYISHPSIKNIPLKILIPADLVEQDSVFHIK